MDHCFYPQPFHQNMPNINLFFTGIINSDSDIRAFSGDPFQVMESFDSERNHMMFRGEECENS